MDTRTIRRYGMLICCCDFWPTCVGQQIITIRLTDRQNRTDSTRIMFPMSVGFVWRKLLGEILTMRKELQRRNLPQIFILMGYKGTNFYGIDRLFIGCASCAKIFLKDNHPIDIWTETAIVYLYRMGLWWGRSLGQQHEKPEKMPRTW